MRIVPGGGGRETLQNCQGFTLDAWRESSRSLGQWGPKSLGRKLRKTFGHGGKESKTCIFKTHSVSDSDVLGAWKRSPSH